MGLANITNNILVDSGILVGNLTPTTRNITINGVGYDLSADRSWTIAAGVSSLASGTGISVATVNGVATVTNLGLLSASSGTGISVSTNNQSITVTNLGLLSAISGTGISASTVNQQLTITNLGLLSAVSGTGISVTTSNQQITVTNTGILSIISGTGISASTVNGATTITNLITNNNQLTNGAGYITSSALSEYATQSYVTSQGYITSSSLSSYLPLSGGTMSGKLFTVSGGTGTYDGAFEIRETGYASNGQSAWGYSPAITFHWGNRHAKRFGMRADGLFAVDDEPLALRSWVTSQGYITGYTETDTLASVTGRGATTTSPITINGGGTQPLSLTTNSGSPWHIALNRTDLGLTSRVFAHNSPYNGWYFEHNIIIAGNTNWHSGNLTNLNQLSNGPGYITSSSLSSYLSLSGGTVTGDVTFGNNSTSDQGIRINYGNYASGYGRIRFMQDGTNHSTIHSFSASWQSGTLQTASSGAINLDGQNGTTIGPWNNPSMWIDNGGVAQARSSFRSPQFRFTNSGNSAYFTGDASWGARIYTDSGYIWFGPANTGHAHIYTDRPNFYFNADILINGTSVVTNNGGTWGISISGNAATATTAPSGINRGDQFHGSAGVTPATSFASIPSGMSGFTDNWAGGDLPSGMAHVHGIACRHYNNTSNLWGWHMVGQYDQPGDLRVRWVNAGTWTGYYQLISSWNIGSQSVNYASSAGNADTVDGYHAAAFPYRSSGTSGYYQVADWMQFNTTAGLYWPSYNGAHIYPNTSTSYGSIRIDGSRNGWRGITFDGSVTLMMNDNESGFYKDGYGWQWRWENGTAYVNKNSYGGGTAATVLDSSNYSSWAQPASSAITTSNIGNQSVSYSNTSGGLNTTFLGSGSTNIDSGFSRVLRNENSNGGNPTYAPVLHLAASDTMWQISAGHGGQTNLVWRSGYAGTWYTWHNILHSGNAGFAWRMNQDVRASDNVEFNQVSIRASLYVGTYQNSSDIYMTDGDEGTRRIHCNSNRIGFLNQAASWGSYCDDAGNWVTDFDMYCNTLNTGNVINIGYTRNGSESIATSSFRGIEFHNPGGDGYRIGKPAGAWTQPLHIAFYTGIRHGANLSYNGHRWYNSTDFATITASINDGDNNMRGFYDIIAYASDRRLKENIQVIDNPIDKVKQLTGMTYQWNEVGSQHGWDPDRNVREAGVFAQDVEAVLPEAVKLAPFDSEFGKSKSGENFLTVKYEKIVPLLIEAIKEQQTQIEDLKSKLDAVTK